MRKTGHNMRDLSAPPANLHKYIDDIFSGNIHFIP